MAFPIEKELVITIASSVVLTLDAATGKTVKQTIIHLPNLGMCFEVK